MWVKIPHVRSECEERDLQHPEPGVDQAIATEGFHIPQQQHWQYEEAKCRKTESHLQQQHTITSVGVGW